MYSEKKAVAQALKLAEKKTEDALRRYNSAKYFCGRGDINGVPASQLSVEANSREMQKYLCEFLMARDVRNEYRQSMGLK